MPSSKSASRVESSGENWDEDFVFEAPQPKSPVLPLRPRQLAHFSNPSWTSVDEDVTVKLPVSSRSRQSRPVDDLYRCSTPSLSAGISTATDGELDTEGFDAEKETELDVPSARRTDGSTPRQRRMLNASSHSRTPRPSAPISSSPRSSDGGFADRSGTYHDDTETEGELDRSSSRRSPARSARPTASSSSLTHSDEQRRRRRLRKSRPSNEQRPPSSAHLPLLDTENVPPRQDDDWSAIPFPSPPLPEARPPRPSGSWTRRFSISRDNTPSRKPSQRQQPSATPSSPPASSSNKLRKHRPTSTISLGGLGSPPLLPSGLFGRARSSSKAQKLEPVVSPTDASTVRASSHRQERTITQADARRAPAAEARRQHPGLSIAVVPSHLTPPSRRIRPMTADLTRAQTIFSSKSSNYGPSENGSAGSTVIASPPRPARRLSMSDLAVPARISTAAVRVGQDLQRVRQFKTGIEELKKMRKTYRSFFSYMSTPPSSAGCGDMGDSPPPPLPDDAEERLTSALERIQQRYIVDWETADVLIALAEGEEAPQPRDRCVSMQPDLVARLDSPNPMTRSISVPTSPPTASSDSLPRDDGRQIELLRGLLEPSQTSLVTAPPALASKPDLVTPRRATVQLDASPTPPVKAPASSGARRASRASQAFMRIFKRSSVIELPPPEAPMSPTRGQDVFHHVDSDEDWDKSPTTESPPPFVGIVVPPRLARVRSRSEDLASHTSSTSSQAIKLALSPDSMPALLERLTEIREHCRSCLTELRGATM